tara:strand:+ start:108 stop:674 length:567 start_codon:yes stop_codon:yes gene_type:complete
MKIDKKYKLEKIVTKDESREALLHIYIDGEAQKAIATNGQAMAIVPVELSEDDSIEKEKLLPAKALTAARKIGGKRIAESEIALNGSVTLSNGESMPYPGNQGEKNQYQIKYPNYKAVIPNPTETGEIHFNPKLLWELCQAIGAENSVTLRIAMQWDGEKGNHKIDPLQPIEAIKGKGKGVLMPMRNP